MATDNGPTQILMGYHGYGGIDWYPQSLNNIEKMEDITSGTGQQILVTGGNISLSYNRPTENMYKAPRSNKNVSPLLLGTGTAQISGSVNFDLTHTNLDYFLDGKKICRNTYFHLYLTDGNTNGTHQITYNMWNSFTISASAGGIVNATLGFISLNGYKDKITTGTGITAADIFANTLVAYWQAGTQGYVESFSINFAQDVTPVYLNNDRVMPSYLRSGAFKLTANIQSCIPWDYVSNIISPYYSDYGFDGNYTLSEDVGSFSFQIGNKTITLNNVFLQTQQYSHSGAGDVAKYSYGLQSVALQPSQTLFTISGGN